MRRARLERVLAGAWTRRITLVVAGGGYGKTTALRGLAGQGPAHWLTLTRGDRDLEVLAAHLAQAVGAGDRKMAAGLGATDRRRLAEERAAAVCERFDARDGPAILIVDDVEQLEDADDATHLLSALCLQAPSHLHVALSGRRVPGLGLGRATGRGELLEIGAPDLALTVEEIEQLLSARLGAGAAPLAGDCWGLTSGWPAAVQLIADRLERAPAGAWGELVAELGRRRGDLWRDFAVELIEHEPPSARRILHIAAIVPTVDAALLQGLGVTGAAAELDGLRRRGLVVGAPERDRAALSPVLSEAVADMLEEPAVAGLRREAAAVLESSGRPAEALECLAANDEPGALALLRRRGRRLIAAGHGARVSELLRGDGSEPAEVRDAELETIRGEALVAVGDWDGAMEVFASLAERAGPLPPAAAWRFGALLYLRNEIDAALGVLSAAHTEEPGDADDALVSAWLSSTLWARGENEEAMRVAAVALRQAQRSGDAGARSAAHVAVALGAAGQGERERNQRHYRLALAAAAEAGDSIQLARIHANLSSRAVEEGDYARAIEEADLALRTGAGHSLFAAVAAHNKAEALMHRGELEEAHALLGQAIEMFSSLGSLAGCMSYALLGAIESERGELARARVTLERAVRLSAESDDVHSLALARAGLARVLAPDDPEAARAHAAAAVAAATSLERAAALCARAWVELVAGDHAAAVRSAIEAEREARRTGDRPALAGALELAGAASRPPDETRLESALALWHELGDPIAGARTGLVLALCREQAGEAQARREELARRGAAPEVGIAGVLAARAGASARRAAGAGAGAGAAEVAITTLGRFAVLRRGEPVPLPAWQSRKARDLLKLLAARRGRPLTRDAAAEALWPDEGPEPLANRLSVALSTLRRVLDPERRHPPDHFVAAEQQALALRMEHVSVDVVRFLAAAHEGVHMAAQGEWERAEAGLREAERLYTGDFLEEDLYEDWAVDCREEARAAAQEVSRLLARAAIRRGDEEEGARHLRRLLERDPYDADAWTALVGAQVRLHRYGEARRQHAVYARRMGELGVAPVALAATTAARP